MENFAENFMNYIKELLFIKKDDKKIIGLMGFRKPPKSVIKKVVKKAKKELNITDLMRRHKTSSIK